MASKIEKTLPSEVNLREAVTANRGETLQISGANGQLGITIIDEVPAGGVESLLRDAEEGPEPPEENESNGSQQQPRSGIIGWVSSSIQTVLSLAILSVCGGIVFWLLWSKTPPKPIVPTTEGLLVETHPITKHDGTIRFFADGAVVPYREIRLAPQVSGRVKSLGQDLRVGSVVKKGDILAEIDANDYLLEVQRLRTQLEHEKSSLQEIEADIVRNKNELAATKHTWEIRKTALKRYLTIDTNGSSPFSKVELDQVKLDELSARKSIQSLTDQANILKAKKDRQIVSSRLVEQQLQVAQLNLKRTAIYSPVDGVVTDIAIETNGYANTGATILTVQDNSKMEVRCKLRQSQMQWIWDQTSESSEKVQDRFSKVSSTVSYKENGAHYQWNAKLDRFDGAGYDKSTRLIPLRVAVDQTKSQAGKDQHQAATLMEGMYVKVAFDVPTERTLYVVPTSSIKVGGILWTVEDGKLKKHQGETIQEENGNSIILDKQNSISSGQMVVVSPLPFPSEGMSVEVSKGEKQ